MLRLQMYENKMSKQNMVQNCLVSYKLRIFAKEGEAAFNVCYV